jgi:hypothetical protein
MNSLPAERKDVRDEKSTIARGGVLAILVLALLGRRRPDRVRGRKGD